MKFSNTVGLAVRESQNFAAAYTVILAEGNVKIVGMMAAFGSAGALPLPKL